MSLSLGTDGERVDAFCKFRFQEIIDRAVHVDAALAFKGRARNHDREMGLAARTGSRMAFMAMGIIRYQELCWSEGFPQFCLDPVAHCHRQ